MNPHEALQRVIEHREIFQEEMVDLMRQIMSGQVSATLIAGILINHRAGGVIADIAVLRIGMIGHGLGRLVDIAHGRQHRIGHHREQQQCQRRQAQESAELA